MTTGGTSPRVYLSSPNNQMQADCLSGHDTLLSFACWSPWIGSYTASFGRLLIDSGAYSAHTQGFEIDPVKYEEWAAMFPDADAYACIDSIRGDWRETLRNAGRFGFPTFHDTDPESELPAFVELAQARGGWLGIGLQPPRTARADFLRRILGEIPDTLHIHGWAMDGYSEFGRFDSLDSTRWLREAGKIRNKLGEWVTPAEATRLAIQKVLRKQRGAADGRRDAPLFAALDAAEPEGGA